MLFGVFRLSHFAMDKLGTCTIYSTVVILFQVEVNDLLVLFVIWLFVPLETCLRRTSAPYPSTHPAQKEGDSGTVTD